MAWLPIVFPLVSAILILFVPGLIVAVVAGVRGLALWAIAPAISLASIAISSVAAGLAHVRWGLIAVITTTAALVVLAFLVRLLSRKQATRVPRPARTRDGRILSWLVFGVAATVIGTRMMMMIGDPINISQTFDNVFHLNAVRYILDTGNASSLTLAGLKPDGHFYPSVWHATASLIVSVSGASIPVAVNALSLAIAAVVWPVGALFLARTISGPAPWSVISAGFVATAFAAYPYLMLDYGVLYPFALGAAVVAPMWALSIQSWRLATEKEIEKVVLWCLLALGSVGVALAHPSALMIVVLLNLVLAAQQAISYLRQVRRVTSSKRPFVLVVGGYLVALTVTALVVLVIRPGNFWPPKSTWPQAFGELLLGGPVRLGMALFLSAFVLWGLILLIRRNSHWWLLASWALFALLFLVGSAERVSWIRSGIIGLWYGDVYRMAAILAIVALPVAALGASDLASLLAARATQWLPRVAPRFIAVVIAAIMLVGLQTSNIGEEVNRGRSDYAMTADSPLLTPDEYQLLQKVDTFVPEGVTVGGNPWTGTALVFALANRPSLFQHVLYTPTADQTLVVEHLQDALTNPQVCEAVTRLKLGYVLDFGTAEVHRERHVFPGFENLAHNPAVKLVTLVGSASLWKITACSK